MVNTANNQSTENVTDINILLEKIQKEGIGQGADQLVDVEYMPWFMWLEGFQDGIALGQKEGHEKGYKEGYADGRLAERKQSLEREMAGLKEILVQPAELYYRAILEIIHIKEEEILQYRLGLDRTTGTPTVLVVIPDTAMDKIPMMRKVASVLEISVYRNIDCDCQFWVTPEISLNQDLINHDFPYVRGNTSALQ
jgi:hypothetical protein